MSIEFPLSSSNVFNLSGDDSSTERKILAQEIKHESASVEEELFLDSDMLISTINNAWEMIHGIDQGDPDIREKERDGTFTPYGVIQQHQEHFLRGWAELLYTGANNSTGSIRLRYAKALNYLRLIVGCDVFELKTKDLHISAFKVSELVKKAVEETGAHRQLFRAFQQ